MQAALHNSLQTITQSIFDGPDLDITPWPGRKGALPAGGDWSIRVTPSESQNEAAFTLSAVTIRALPADPAQADRIMRRLQRLKRSSVHLSGGNIVLTHNDIFTLPFFRRRGGNIDHRKTAMTAVNYSRQRARVIGASWEEALFTFERGTC